ncbi:hypothetical protein BC332_11285 [Capsicum chinense]|nr:hypothetical protein BC332_11285 [Capsicum chinense]
MAKRQQLSNNFALKKCPKQACAADDHISQLMKFWLDFSANKPLDEVALNRKLRKMHMKKFTHHEIDKWLEFAFARQVQRLELDFLKGGVASRYSHYCYTFPAQLLGLNDYAGQPHSNYVHKLPPLLHNSKSLKEYMGKYKFPEFTMLKKFAVVVDTLEDTGLLGCTSVIEDAPQLEEFKLKINAKSDLDILSSSSRN